MQGRRGTPLGLRTPVGAAEGPQLLDRRAPQYMQVAAGIHQAPPRRRGSPRFNVGGDRAAPCRDGNLARHRGSRVSSYKLTTSHNTFTSRALPQLESEGRRPHQGQPVGCTLHPSEIYRTQRPRWAIHGPLRTVISDQRRHTWTGGRCSSGPLPSSDALVPKLSTTANVVVRPTLSIYVHGGKTARRRREATNVLRSSGSPLRNTFIS